MKKVVLIFCLIVSFRLAAQIPNMPDSINYQAVLRDASGAVMPVGTTGTLNFRIYSDFISVNADYEENHSFTTNAVGLVNLYIGGGSKVGNNTFANVNWSTGAASYEVRLNGTLISPRQAFAAVPYALYAKSSGSGSLPQGLVNQTMYYDASSGWKGTNNLANDGVRVGIGLAPSSRIKLHVASNDPNDSTLIHASKINAGIGDAGFRGSMIGNTNTSSISPFAPVFGADIRSSNNGNGYAIGIAGSANSSNGGTGIGVSAVAKGPSTSTLVGLYATVDTLSNPNAFAAVFEKGKVLIGGDVYFPNAASSAGYVYKIDAQKKGYWGLGSGGNSSITINQSGIVNVSPSGTPSTLFTISAAAPIFGTSGIGTVVPGAYPNYNLNIPNPSINFNAATGNLAFSQTPFSTNLNISPNVSFSGSLITVGTNTALIPGANIWSKPTATAVALVSGSDYVGIGTTTPLQKLDVQGYIRVGAGSLPVDEGWLLYSPSPGLSILRAGGRATTEMRLDQNNNAPMTFWANGTERVRILANGNVGIGIAAPSEMLHVNGNVIIPSANDYEYVGVKTHYVNINPSALQYAGTASGIPVISTNGGQIALDGTAASLIGYFVAPLNLPDGAIITGASAYIDDPLTGANDYVDINVNQIVNSSGATSLISSFGTTGPGTTSGFQQQSSGILSWVVNNNLNSYCLAITMGNTPSIRLRNIKITYTVSKAD